MTRSKFGVGNVVKQITSGYNTSPHDNGKMAIVAKTGGLYEDWPAIKLEGTIDWECDSTGWRAEEAFELVQNPGWDI